MAVSGLYVGFDMGETVGPVPGESPAEVSYSDISLKVELVQASGASIPASMRVEDHSGAHVRLLTAAEYAAGKGLDLVDNVLVVDGETILPDSQQVAAARFLMFTTAAAAADALVCEAELRWKVEAEVTFRAIKTRKKPTKKTLGPFYVSLDADADYSGKYLDGVTVDGQPVVNLLEVLDPVAQAAATDQFAAAMASRASTSRAAQRGHSFPSLVDGSGDLLAAIQDAWDDGELALDDTVTVRSYHPGSGLGGGSYNVVASATGTDDGGSYIDGDGFQLEAVWGGGEVNARRYGARGDATTDDTAALQAAIDFLGQTFGEPNFGNTERPSILYIPSGRYKITDTLSQEKTADGHAGMWIRGDGGARTLIEAPVTTFATAPAFRFSTETGNYRELIMSDLMIRGGTIGLDLYRVKYSQFQRIRFFQQGEYAIRVEQGGQNQWSDLRITETTHDSIHIIGGTGDDWADIVVGELAGNILISGGRATFTGGKFFGAWDRQNPAGYNSMGPAIFTVKASGTLHVTGAEIQCYENLCNVQLHRSVSFVGCSIIWGSSGVPHSGHLVSSEVQSGRPGTIALRSNTITIPIAASTCELVKAHTVNPIVNSLIVDNDIHVITGASITVDDSLNDPANGNLVAGNVYTETSVV